MKDLKTITNEQIEAIKTKNKREAAIKADMLKCKADNISIDNWCEDINESDEYPYSVNNVETFCTKYLN